LIGRGTGPLDPSPGYAPAQDFKRCSLTEKIRPVIPIMPILAGIMPVTEKTRILRTEIWLRPKLRF